MLALIDCDIFCYEFGHAKNEYDQPLDWNLVVWRIENRISQILEATQAEAWDGFLTGPGNFREQVATILPYKGNRDRGERPYWYAGIYDYLSSMPNVTVVVGKEADDEIADRHSDGVTIICSRDKDFRQLTGWHYSWPSYKQEERPPYYVSDIDGQRSLYAQILTGDSADNILGLYGVGSKSTLVAKLGELSSREELLEHTYECYLSRFGAYAPTLFLENWRLLKLGDVENGLYSDVQTKKLQ